MLLSDSSPKLLCFLFSVLSTLTFTELKNSTERAQTSIQALRRELPLSVAKSLSDFIAPLLNVSENFNGSRSNSRPGNVCMCTSQVCLDQLKFFMLKVERDSAEHMYPGIFAQSRHLAVSLESQAGCLSSWTAHFCFRLQCPMQFGSYILWLPPALGCCWEGGMAARAGSAESLC